jgi:4a-hydroxytetrahydrobiopterin dehydratase
MSSLSQVELNAFLESNGSWKLDDGKLVRDWSFPDFVGAMEFVNRVAELAEKANHHPDIDIRYNKVRLGLVSHDAGGITDRDRRMAETLNQHFS